MQGHLVWLLSFLRNCECLTSQQFPSKETRVLPSYGRRGSFIGAWARSPALGDGQDSSEPHSLAARERWAHWDSLIVWYLLQHTGKRIGLKSGRFGRVELPPPFSPSPGKRRAAHTQIVRVLPSALVLSPGVPEANSLVSPGHRRAQHTLKTLKRKVSPSANLKFQS